MPISVSNSPHSGGLTKGTIIRRLENAFMICRVANRVGYYTASFMNTNYSGQQFKRSNIIERVAVAIGDRYFWRYSFVWALTSSRRANLHIVMSEIEPLTTTTSSRAESVSEPIFREAPHREDLPRTIRRERYHSQPRNVLSALARLREDADGVKRSFGLEWEINALTDTQEDKLARLLDTLPPHITEADGSLSNSGVEIIFEPMAEATFISTFQKLKNFVLQEGVSMENTGAHTTYGVSNSRTNVSNLQIRLNRLALAVKAVGTQQNIRQLFGRDFTSYACLPMSTTQAGHSMSFNASRGDGAWECRLVNYQADQEKLVEFIKATEFVFQRAVKASDFIKIFEIMGADTSAA